MSSRSKFESHSLGYHFLDNGVNTEARDMPMASADFGAESGSYFLRSTGPDSKGLTNYPEYKLESDPHINLPPKNKIKPHRRKKTNLPTGGAAAQNTATNASEEEPDIVIKSEPAASGCQTAVRWETLPGCLVETVVGVTQDLTRKIGSAQAAPTESLGDIFTKESRLTYLSILFLLLFLVYRIFR